jgi:hypothetical protein
VQRKNRKLYFGILLHTMVKDLAVDPKGDLLKTIAAARDTMADGDFEGILKGRRGNATIAAAFGLSDPTDIGVVTNAIDRAARTPFPAHPFCRSLKMKGGSGTIPDLVEGNPGFGAHADGRAGGLPLDAGLKPCAFFARNLAEFFAAA